jgi:hypothetical protein
MADAISTGCGFAAQRGELGDLVARNFDPLGQGRGDFYAAAADPSTRAPPLGRFGPIAASPADYLGHGLPANFNNFDNSNSNTSNPYDDNNNDSDALIDRLTADLDPQRQLQDALSPWIPPYNSLWPQPQPPTTLASSSTGALPLQTNSLPLEARELDFWEVPITNFYPLGQHQGRMPSWGHPPPQQQQQQQQQRYGAGRSCPLGLLEALSPIPPSSTSALPSFDLEIDTVPALAARQLPEPLNLPGYSQPSLTLPPPSAIPGEPTSDDYVSALAVADFSSPSLPPIYSSPFHRPPTRFEPPALEISAQTHGDMPTAPRRLSRASRGEGVVDLTTEDSAFGPSPDSPSNNPSPMAPQTRKRAHPSVATSSPTGPKRRRTSQSSILSAKPRRSPAQNDPNSPIFDSFKSSPPRDIGQDGPESIDLSNSSEVPEELMAPKVDNRIKLGNFQCVICMDDVTSLTVTHCGHLFCSECLHSALHIDSMKKTCPVCRTKVDLKDKKGKNTKTFYHLELKVMTANRKGKRPIGN